MARDCPNCGLVSPLEAQRCDCGYDFVTNRIKQSRIEQGQQYKGIGGWLLLLCVGLTVFTPIRTLGSLAGSYIESAQYFEQFPGLLIVTVVDTILSLGLMAFSVYAGLGLWRIRAGAVETAKNYLWWFLAYHVVAAALPFGLPSEAHRAMMEQVVKNMVGAVVAFAIWYSYLNRSKRVKATYGLRDSEVSGEQRRCPQCLTAYNIQDYRADVPTIYCSGCGARLPR